MSEKGIRELAEQWLKDLLESGGVGHVTYACFEDKHGKEWKVPDLLTAFAESIVEQYYIHRPDKAAHGTCKCIKCAVSTRELKAARKEEMEQCCKDVCHRCICSSLKMEPAVKIGDDWVHMRDGNRFECLAFAIRSRWQRGEGQ